MTFCCLHGRKRNIGGKKIGIGSLELCSVNVALDTAEAASKPTYHKALDIS